MKKKKLKSLVLSKHSVSNLSLLYQKFGGQETSDSQTDTNHGFVSLQIPCPTAEGETCLQTECYGDCGTNGGTQKSPPPTEYNTCNCNPPGF
ncbi:hypothetical protein C8N46_101819 [Kordia periserrulae]|uniref:Uncharacterized protein n=1 Tax=Kordia periserrulae TaxID=701523 RepID=A0A2T6C7A9_9FLAO|nr:hypothetical protein [Kordia periserrulae]PTX64208.1 hypothetical protein C8N46_101819 [Kordia periserrulae]